MPAFTPYPQIICLGDSITQGAWVPGGFVQQLAADYTACFDVINRGMGGYTSRQLVLKLAEDQLTQDINANVKLIIVAIGTNDSVLPNGSQHVPIDDYRRNLSSILSALRSNFPSARLLLLAPTIVDPEAWIAFRKGQDPKAEKDRSVEAQRAYADACVEVGKQEGVVAVDQHAAMRAAIEKGEVKPIDVLSDGLHLTSKGYEILYPFLRKAIDDNFPELRPDAVSKAFMDWDRYHM